MQLFDAHTHVDMKHFKHDLGRVIERAKAADVVGMVTSSINPGSFRRTLGIVKKWKGYILHSAGCQASRMTAEDTETTIGLIEKYKESLVAVGEVGLDYHWVKDEAGRKAQEPLFMRYIETANNLGLPLVIHSRKAEERATEILSENSAVPVLMHCYDGPPSVTKVLIDLDYYITLPANFARYRSRVKAAEMLPLERIMLETDGPYLSPVKGRNEPANIIYGCKSLAEVKDLSVDKVAGVTTKNAQTFYRL